MLSKTPLEDNARDLEAELVWFAEVVDARMRQYFESAPTDIRSIPAPDLTASTSPYARFVLEHGLSFDERLALVLALTPHIRPHLLDLFHIRNETFDRHFTEFGGFRGDDGSFWPTGETLAFILGGIDLAERFRVQALLDPDRTLFALGILHLAPARMEQPSLKMVLRLLEEPLGLFTTGTIRPPVFGANFPAQRIETRLTWDDLVLHPHTKQQTDEIVAWIEHGRTLMDDWGMAAKLRPGYRSLFYGPPGTGKTMTACLLAKATGRDVYKVDLSLVVSKYIGETEKNLSLVFDQAESKGWILFFDEADALFGKRTESKDAHDRYANQEVAFLLQRIETFDGITILASNLRDNMDDAFARRFESIIYFPLPRPEDRLLLWRQGFSAKARLDDTVDLAGIARDHDLSGGAIMNAIRATSLQALKEGDRPITHNDLTRAVRREYAKEGRLA